MWPGGCGAEAGISSSVAWSDDRKNPVIYGKILEMCEIFWPKRHWCALAIKQQSQHEVGWTHSDLSDVFAKQPVMSGTWLSWGQSRNALSVWCQKRYYSIFTLLFSAEPILSSDIHYYLFDFMLTSQICPLKTFSICFFTKSGAYSPPQTLVVPFLQTPAPQVVLSAAARARLRPGRAQQLEFTSVSFKNTNSDFQGNPEVLQVRRCDKNRLFYVPVRIAHRLIMSLT